MRLDRDEVREEIASAEREIFDDEIQCVVGVLNARDGDVPDLMRMSMRQQLDVYTNTYPVDDRRQDDLADVHPELGLELECALAIEEQVLREACPVVSEAIRYPLLSIASEDLVGRRRTAG